MGKQRQGRFFTAAESAQIGIAGSVARAEADWPGVARDDLPQPVRSGLRVLKKGAAGASAFGAGDPPLTSRQQQRRPARGRILLLSVSGNGAGMPVGENRGKPGLGTGIVEALSKQLDATVTVLNASPGTGVEVRRG